MALGRPERPRRAWTALRRYLPGMPSTPDTGKPYAPDDALVVVDEHFQQSLQDPRVRQLFTRGDALLAQLDAERANF